MTILKSEFWFWEKKILKLSKSSLIVKNWDSSWTAIMVFGSNWRVILISIRYYIEHFRLSVRNCPSFSSACSRTRALLK